MWTAATFRVRTGTLLVKFSFQRKFPNKRPIGKLLCWRCFNFKRIQEVLKVHQLEISIVANAQLSTLVDLHHNKTQGNTTL